MLWLAFSHPIAALVVVLVLTVVAIWLIPKLWRTIGRIFTRVRGWFGHATATDPTHDRG